VSTPDGRGHSGPPSAVGKVYREFAVDHDTCHAFLYACTQIFLQTFHLTLQPFDEGCRESEGIDSFLCEEFGRKMWRQRVALIRSRATSFFTDYVSCGAHVTILRAPVI